MFACHVRGIWLTINPRSDAEFVACAERLGVEAADIADFERRLREHYPHIVVRPRELTGEHESFYVYRDGHWAGEA